ncbi:hypothetical protein [Priestia sp. P5]|uniref:hypothetical protein n=1 Tax=Priestia sp. P5 TaxID=2917806 RepID=UPI002406E0EF|nr:hypothetical protein [Priestia sp. P5]MDG0061915.1 hypothetical protein [Priestia sp. P5]
MYVYINRVQNDNDNLIQATTKKPTKTFPLKAPSKWKEIEGKDSPFDYFSAFVIVTLKNLKTGKEFTAAEGDAIILKK